MDDFTGKVVKEMCKKSGMGIDPMLLRVKSASITEPLPQSAWQSPARAPPCEPFVFCTFALFLLGDEVTPSAVMCGFVRI